MAAPGDGPSIAASALSGPSPPAWRPTAAEEGAIPLPPEQRGRVYRCLADDEGVVEGRWMDVPLPGEVWGGAVGLTRAIVDCVLLPFPFPGKKSEGGERDAKAPGGAAAAATPPEEEGTELEEKLPYVRVITVDDGGNAAADAHSAPIPPRSDDDDFVPDCVTVPPEPGCLPGGPLDSGEKVRRSVRTAPQYFREADEDVPLPTPLECFADVGTFTQQAATCIFPVYLFLPTEGQQREEAQRLDGWGKPKAAEAEKSAEAAPAAAAGERAEQAEQAPAAADAPAAEAPAVEEAEAAPSGGAAEEAAAADAAPPPPPPPGSPPRE